MKMVIYNKNQYYFLTDNEFELAVESWNKKLPIYFKKLGFYLPPPRNPAGVIPEHKDLQLAFSFDNEVYGLPGWIGIQKPVSPYRRGAVYVRVPEPGGDTTRYIWKELNPVCPQNTPYSNFFTDDDVLNFINKLSPIMVDEVLERDDLRSTIPFEPLLPAYAFE